ncbi:zinc ribbon domain-containing protein [Alkaliphilus hydrothermalis]|uniref:Recombinase zinc beta ribbon domain-containing protein n=1 Tax=Alkaliphilus hydrothermalis TaxID=1482730 RepID=A0ABS2NML8_9FIRM|nr:hypothetical protein [Alkaliphilus hydrothermalis]
MLNAFDLVRIHKFGNLDDRASENTPPSKLPSFINMCEFAIKDDEVKGQFAKERMEQATDDFTDDTWQTALELDKQGKIKDTLDNIVLIIRNDKELESIAFNKHRDGIDARNGLPWDQMKAVGMTRIMLPLRTFCGECGDIYRRVYWNVHGRKEFVWRCVTRIEQGPEVCRNRTVKEGDLYDAVMTAINKLLAGGDNMIRTLEENNHAVIGDTTEYKISEINTLLEDKQKEVINLANKGKDYEFLADEIDKLSEERQSLLVEDASLSGENERSTN